MRDVFKRLGYLLLLNLVLAACVSTVIPNNAKVAIRDLAFSDIYTDGEVQSQEQLDKIIGHGFKRAKDADVQSYYQYLDAARLEQLKILKLRAPDDDTYIARAIGAWTSRSTLPDLERVCGVDGLKATVTSVSRQKGCCSDFARTYIAYANALQLPVRRTSNADHSAVEYFDRRLAKWVWLDPYMRTQIASEDGELLNQYEIRNRKHWKALTLIALSSVDSSNDAVNYYSYMPKGYGLISWLKGVNDIEIDRYDTALRRIGMGKALRQMVLLIAGIQPGYVLLTTERIALYLRLSKILLLSLIIVYGIANLCVLLRLPAFSKRIANPN